MSTLAHPACCTVNRTQPRTRPLVAQRGDASVPEAPEQLCRRGGKGQQHRSSYWCRTTSPTPSSSSCASPGAKGAARLVLVWTKGGPRLASGVQVRPVPTSRAPGPCARRSDLISSSHSAAERARLSPLGAEREPQPARHRALVLLAALPPGPRLGEEQSPERFCAELPGTCPSALT